MSIARDPSIAFIFDGLRDSLVDLLLISANRLDAEGRIRKACDEAEATLARIVGPSERTPASLTDEQIDDALERLYAEQADELSAGGMRQRNAAFALARAFAARVRAETPAPGVTAALAARLCDEITGYLATGGLFNPEMANHDAVRDLLIDCRRALSAVPPEPPTLPPEDQVRRGLELAKECGAKYANAANWHALEAHLTRMTQTIPGGDWDGARALLASASIPALTLDEQYWVRRRAEIIDALAYRGLQIMSNRDSVWISGTDGFAGLGTPASGVPDEMNAEPSAHPAGLIDGTSSVETSNTAGADAPPKGEQ